MLNIFTVKAISIRISLNAKEGFYTLCRWALTVSMTPFDMKTPRFGNLMVSKVANMVVTGLCAYKADKFRDI